MIFQSFFFLHGDFLQKGLPQDWVQLLNMNGIKASDFKDTENAVKEMVQLMAFFQRYLKEEQPKAQKKSSAPSSPEIEFKSLSREEISSYLARDSTSSSKNVFICLQGRLSGRKVCVKQYRSNMDTLKTVYSELFEFTENHASLLVPEDCFFNESRLFLVWDNVNLSNLADLIYEQELDFEEKHIARICKQILKGLHFLHIRNIFHGKLSVESVFLDKENGRVKLGDIQDHLPLNSRYMTPRTTRVSS